MATLHAALESAVPDLFLQAVAEIRASVEHLVEKTEGLDNSVCGLNREVGELRTEAKTLNKLLLPNGSPGFIAETRTRLEAVERYPAKDLHERIVQLEVRGRKEEGRRLGRREVYAVWGAVAAAFLSALATASNLFTRLTTVRH